MDKYYNPYQTQELRYPKQCHDWVLRYTQTKSTDGRKSRPAQSPFPRMIDLWFLAVCIGARKGKRTRVSKEESTKFIEGSIFSSDPWRVDMLSLLAIGYTGNTEILNQPREVIQLANELAATGYPEVFQMLEEGRSEPIWNISHQLFELLQTAS